MTGHRRAPLAAVIAMGAATALALAACSSTSSSPTSSAASTTAAAAGTKVTACDSGSSTEKQLKLGTFLPLTGSLASYGPAAVGAVDLALADINAAGGVNGTAACITSSDSSDADNPTVGAANIKKLLQSKVSAIVGPESSSVTENVLPTVAASDTVLFSPAATADSLTGASKWFFRNPAPNTFEAAALGQRIAADGHTKTAILVFNDAYGINLRDGIETAIEKAGGKVVYGAKGKNQEFSTKETNFGSDVSAALATDPDSLVVIAFDQTVPLVKQLVSSSWKMKNSYFVDGNIGDYTSSLPKGTLDGVIASTQGVNPSTSFQQRVQAAYTANGGSKPITTYGYAAESYDAATLIALAAVKAKSSDPVKIQAEIAAVSGSDGGNVCKSFAACKSAIDAGEKITYLGYAGTGPFNDKNNVSSGYISLYQYVSNNPSKFLGSVKESD